MEYRGSGKHHAGFGSKANDWSESSQMIDRDHQVYFDEGSQILSDDRFLREQLMAAEPYLLAELEQFMAVEQFLRRKSIATQEILANERLVRKQRQLTANAENQRLLQEVAVQPLLLPCLSMEADIKAIVVAFALVTFLAPFVGKVASFLGRKKVSGLWKSASQKKDSVNRDDEK